MVRSWRDNTAHNEDVREYTWNHDERAQRKRHDVRASPAYQYTGNKRRDDAG